MATEQKFKIWKCGADSASGFMITPDSAIIAGTDENFIVVDSGGTNIAGPVSFMTSSDQVRQGGLFVQLPDFVRMIPGTMVTPIPPQIPFPPVALIASVATMLPALLSLMQSAEENVA